MQHQELRQRIEIELNLLREDGVLVRRVRAGIRRCVLIETVNTRKGTKAKEHLRYYFLLFYHFHSNFLEQMG